jgi:hypothetical protein
MGQLISKLLFQPPDPPSYSDNGDGKIIWLTCHPPKTPKKRRENGGILKSSNNDSDFEAVLTETNGNAKPVEKSDKNITVQIPACFLPYKGYGF